MLQRDAVRAEKVAAVARQDLACGTTVTVTGACRPASMARNSAATSSTGAAAAAQVRSRASSSCRLLAGEGLGIWRLCCSPELLAEGER